jgi:hypothetical protein
MTGAAGETGAGTNLKGEASGAAWTYLLDSLEVGRLLCLGVPSPASRRTLERVAGELVVADRVSDIPPGRFDVISVAGAPRSGVGPEVLADLAQRLEAGGVLYVEGRTHRRLERASARAGLAPRSMFRMTPATGEVESAVPVDDTVIARWFRRHGITARRGRSRLSRIVHRILPTPDATRIGLFATREISPGAERVQAYIRTAAEAAGLDLTAHRVGLAARGRYGSRKVIAYLFAPDRTKPDLVVKMTRDPSHNERLLNEERALIHVAERRLADVGTAPLVLFSADHGSLRIVAESAIEGSPLSEARSPRGTADAFRWLIELSARSVDRGPAATARRAASIDRVVSEVDRIYRLPPSTSERLESAARRVIDGADAMPTVFMHGDAAAWNVLLRPDGRVAFLDWEAADADGMPLWDLFHFARSHVIAGAGFGRLARRPGALLRTIAGDELTRSAVAAYIGRLGIDPRLVAPLMTLCWAHRALREVTRLEAADREASHYLGLMEASLDPDRG